MNTKNVTDRAERKALKRKARKEAETANPLKPRDYERGSKKRKVKKLAKGQRKR
jgi:hypothetical protein